MSDTESITFNLPKKLKGDFEDKIKNSGFTVSSALRELMKRYIEEPVIISSSAYDITQAFESRIQQIEQSSNKELSKRLQQLDLLIARTKEQFQVSTQTEQKSLNEEILAILKADKAVRKSTYPETEKAILEKYEQFKQQILRSKEQGNDPITETINILREEQLVKYNYKTRKLTWV